MTSYSPDFGYSPNVLNMQNYQQTGLTVPGYDPTGIYNFGQDFSTPSYNVPSDPFALPQPYPQPYQQGNSFQWLFDLMGMAQNIFMNPPQQQQNPPSFDQPPYDVVPPQVDQTGQAPVVPQPVIPSIPQPMDGQTAVETILNNRDYFDSADGNKDGLVTKDGLQKIVNDPNVPENVKAAARIMLDDIAFRAADATENNWNGDDYDGKISFSELEKAKNQRTLAGINPAGAHGTMNANQAIDIINQNFDLIDTAAGVGQKDGLIGKNDLEAIVNDPNASPELKAACQFLLNNQTVWNTVDLGNIGSNGQQADLQDGLLARSDLDGTKQNGSFNNWGASITY